MALALAPGAAADQAEPGAVAGARVAGIEIRSDAPLPRQEVARLIVVEPGEPLSGGAVRASLRNLHALGVAGEVEAYVRPAPADQVIVVFVLWASVQVDEVRIEGELAVKASKLRPALSQRVGEPLVEDRVIRGLYRLQDRYRELGYPRASVRVEVPVDEGRKRARVVYRVDAGPPSVVAEIEFEGELGPFTPSDLEPQLKLGVGKRYREAAARADAERLQIWLVRRDHRSARVGLPRAEETSRPGGVRLIVPVTAGPRFDIEVNGADLGSLRKKGLLPFLADEGYDEALVLLAVSKLRAHYQGEGHYKVAVESSLERGDEIWRLRLDIDRGPVFGLETIGFTGNEQARESTLLQLMETAPRRALGGGGRLVDEVLATDIDNIRSWYALSGYGQVRVGPAQIAEEGDRLRLTVPIEEGPRRTVESVTLRGVAQLPEADVERALGLKPGSPYHEQILAGALDRVRSLYELHGYDTAQVSAAQEPGEDGGLALTVHVLEGEQARVGRIVVRGNRRTRTTSLLRWIGLEPGEVLSHQRLLEAQSALYRLGIFSRVQIDSSPATRYGARRNLVVRLEEARPQRFSYGLGYDSEAGARGLLGYSHGNVLGRGLAFDIDLRWSQRESLARALVRQPFTWRWPVPVTYSIFRVEEQQTSFDSIRRGAQVEAARQFQTLRLGLFYTYKLVELDDVAPGLEELEIDRDLREVEISSLSPSLLWDRRDDPVEPRSGWSVLFQTEYAFPLLQAEAEFVKAFTHETAYLDLGRSGVVAASVRAGGIEPVGINVVDPTVPAGLPSALVPISERFFAGGRTTHRAYALDELGIPGETIIDGSEIGGNGLLLANLDYRYPITETIWATAFVDAGNVWADWRDLDPEQMKLGAGVGARYLSPIGPLRLEIGWKLDREPGEDPYVVFISFGNPF